MMHSQETLAQHAPHNAEAADEYKVKTDSNPDQRQAWRVVIGMAVTVCILFGTTISAFGVFTPHITTTFQSSNEQTANIATAFIFSMTLAMPLAGWLLDRVGPRLVMTLGTLLMGSGYLFASVSQDINSLILALALSGLGVGASTYIPATALVMRWVELKRQALALGVLVSGISMGTIIFPMLLTYITELYDWRFAMQLIAALAFLVCVPLLLWLARLPCQPLPGSEEHCNMVELTGQTVKQALRLPRYWLWVAMQVLLTFSTLGIVINIKIGRASCRERV